MLADMLSRRATSERGPDGLRLTVTPQPRALRLPVPPVPPPGSNVAIFFNYFFCSCLMYLSNFSMLLNARTPPPLGVPQTKDKPFKASPSGQHFGCRHQKHFPRNFYDQQGNHIFSGGLQSGHRRARQL